MQGDDKEDAAANELDALLQRTEPKQRKESRRERLYRKFKSLFFPKSRKKAHHRTRTSLGEVWGSISHGLESIAEGVQAEAELIGETLVEELNEAEQGNRYFLDMSMTRSLSVIPEDIPIFVDEAVGEELPHEIPPEEANILVRYAGLLMAVLAVSSNGTAQSLLQNVPPPLKLYWRMTATALVLFFFAFRHTWKEGFPRLNVQQWVTFGGAVFCYAVHAICFLYALNYTSIGNAIIGANSQAILLILGKLIMGHKVILLEGGGVALAFAGAILCSTDEARDGVSEGGVLGDLLAVASGVLGVGYLTFAKACRSCMPVTLFMFMNMIFGSAIVLLFMLIAGIDLSISRDPFNGLIGWTNADEYRIYIMIHIAVVCNIVGTMGFVRAMQYFENVIIAVATLLEPMIATIIAFVVGVGHLPGPWGWLGNVFVLVGTFLVVLPSVNTGAMSH